MDTKIKAFPDKEEIKESNVDDKELETTLQMIEDTRQQLLNRKQGIIPKREDLAFGNENKDKVIPVETKPTNQSEQINTQPTGQPEQIESKFDAEALKVLQSKTVQQPVQAEMKVNKTETSGLVMSVPEGYNPIIQDNINQPFDIIPIPSEGKIYKHKKNSVKIAFLNASDENLLTSPNLLVNGKYIKILLKRKILDPDFNYDDLHVGDRNAILVWLRATAWGPEYDIIVPYPDKEDDTFPVQINLNDLKFKKLTEEPDINGNLLMTLPLSGDKVIYRFLNMKDLEELIAIDEYEREVLNLEFTNTLTYRLERNVVSINDNTDSNYIRNKIVNMKPKDARFLRNTINELEPGIEQDITVQTPGGESVDTYFPINDELFWTL